MSSKQEVKCPKCGALISIDEVLTSQIKESVEKEFENEMKDKEAKIEAKEKELETQKGKMEEEQRNLQAEIEKRVAEDVKNKKATLVEEIKAEVNSEKELEMRMLEEKLVEKERRLKEANENELELRKEKNRIEEEKKNFEIEKQRQLDEERKKIEEEAGRKAEKEEKYKIAQLQKKLDDALKVNEEQKRRLEQGSQQMQGEVLELELENVLRSNFLLDEISPVPKGVSGADIIQKVKTNGGRYCGQIAWESKKTKMWSEGWIQKLKDDQRTVKADLAVIVSMTLPEGVNGFTFRDDVWICDVNMALPLATALRINLQNLACERSMSVGKDEKMEALYAYISGVEFQQKVKAVIEAFICLQDGVNKERMAYAKIWSEREKQIQKVLNNTVGMYGDLSGLAPLPQLPMLELGKDINL